MQPNARAARAARRSLGRVAFCSCFARLLAALVLLAGRHFGGFGSSGGFVLGGVVGVGAVQLPNFAAFCTWHTASGITAPIWPLFAVSATEPTMTAASAVAAARSSSRRATISTTPPTSCG
mgnify:CR=1 FL=1